MKWVTRERPKTDHFFCLWLIRSLFMLLLCSSFNFCKSQNTSGTSHLLLLKTILLPDVKGRIDHLDVNLKDQLVYVAALGNNTLEVADLNAGRVIHTFKGLDEPQGVGYIPQTHELLVANGGSGDCYFFNSKTFEKTGTVHLGSDADDVRCDSVAKKIYVGYGSGAIAVIDAETHQQTADIKLPVHPESFQIDRKLNLLFVNLPDAHMVGVVDLKRSILISKWVRESPTANFPMALDTIHHRVFVGYRHPAALLVIDGLTGKEISNQPMAGDADDLYYDEKQSTIYVSGGDGSVFVFQETDKNIFKQIIRQPTRSGARTSLYVPELNIFVLAARAASGGAAELLVYKFIL
jgi:hypothetical protein